MPNINVEKYLLHRAISMSTPHSHDHYEIQFLMKGERLYFIEDKSYSVPPNSIIVVPPRIKHMTGGGAFSRYNVNVFPAALSEYDMKILNKFLPEHARGISEEKMQEISVCIEHLMEIPPSPQYDEKAQAILTYIFYLMDSALTENTKAPLDSIKAPIMIYRITDYINCNIQNELSLDIIANHFHCSVPYLRKLFTTYMKHPLYDYILMLRIKKVKELLTTTNHSVAEIAALCGFSSSNYLCLMFKRKEGISPLAYKKLRLR